MFIGSRMHACIAALSQGVPTVGLAYSDKFRGVFESLGLERLVADLRALEAGEVVEIIDGALCGADQVRDYLARIMVDVRSSILGMLGPGPTSDGPAGTRAEKSAPSGTNGNQEAPAAPGARPELQNPVTHM
jgi:hypothetical protein